MVSSNSTPTVKSHSHLAHVFAPRKTAIASECVCLTRGRSHEVGCAEEGENNDDRRQGLRSSGRSRGRLVDAHEREVGCFVYRRGESLRRVRKGESDEHQQTRCGTDAIASNDAARDVERGVLGLLRHVGGAIGSDEEIQSLGL